MVRIKLKRFSQCRRELMGHQNTCLNWIRHSRVIHPALFMDMRLGKTLTAVRCVSDVWRINGPCLVTAPVTVLEAWEKELQLEGEAYRVAHGLPLSQRIEVAQWAFSLGEKYEKQTGRKWVLINYDSLRATPGLATLEWQVAIMDESTALRNPQAKISKLCTLQFRDVKHRMILSGLPSPEGELNLFQQFKFLHGGFMSHDNYYKFRVAYFEPADMFGSDWHPTPEARKAIKKEVYNKAFVLRRQDAGIAGKKIRETRTIPMLKEQRIVYDKLEKEFATWIDQGETEVLHETSHVIVQQMWMARVAGGCDAEGTFRWNPKVAELVNLLTDQLANQPVVIWFRFNSEIKAVEAALTQAGIECGTLIGENERSARKDTLEWFRSSKNPARALLCQVKLAKYGVDASAADTAIYYSMTYSCEEIAQSEDRIFHPMKKSPLLYVYLVMDDSIDQDIIYAVSTKVTSAKLLMIRFKEAFNKRRSLNARQ